MSDSESDPFAHGSNSIEFRDGRADVRFGRKVKTVRPRLSLAAKTIWNRTTHRELTRLMREFQPEVMHCTNTLPLISPSAYYAARSSGVAVVQSLRNYRHINPFWHFRISP